MSSLKNSPGLYSMQQAEMKKQNEYLFNNIAQVPYESKMPDLGVNVGNMRGGFYSNVLSHNTSDIESTLFGIKQRDLTKPVENKTFILKKLGTQEFFKTPRVFIPEPLVVQRNQRPIGPFSGR